MFHIGWVEINDIFDALFWHFAKQRLYEISVRIDKCKSTSVHHVLICHIFLQYRFTDTGLTDNVDVSTTIFFRNTNRLFRAAKLVIPDQHPFVHRIRRTIHLF